MQLLLLIIGILLPLSAIGVYFYRKWYFQNRVDAQFVLLGLSMATIMLIYYSVSIIAGLITIAKFFTSNFFS